MEEHIKKVSFLDLDFYKISMGQFVWKNFPDTIVKYEFKNRTKDVMLGSFVSLKSIQESLEKYKNSVITDEESEYLKGLGYFKSGYIKFLKNINLPTPECSISDDGQLKISVTGKWSEAIYWETVILSVVNELYCAQAKDKISEFTDVMEEGRKRLSEKIMLLKKYKDIRFSEFGTRRRYSLEWQEEVLQTLIKEVPEQIIGTSNVHLSMKYGIPAIGTIAHELTMAASALFGDSDVDIFNSHSKMLDMWYKYYGKDLSIALTDTYGSSPFFFEDFGAKRAKKWKGLRQDSGNPFDFANTAIEFYKKLGINPKKKILICSDGLDVHKIISLHNAFHEKINISFGWGTDLTNSVGVKPLSLVMKAVECNGKGLVKLSDNIAKATGKPEDINRFKSIFNYTNVKEEKLVY